MTTIWNPYAAHPADCPCPACGWARGQNAKLDARQDPDPVPGSQRAACGHPDGCSCPPHVKQRARIAAREQAAAELVEAERARRRAAAEAAAGDLPGVPEPEPAWVPREGCTCRKCRMRRMELVLEQPQQIQADFRTRYYAGRPCVRHAVPAPDCSSCAANAGLTVIRAGEEITSGTITVDIPGSAGFRDPAAREGASVPAEPAPDFRTRYYAGRPCVRHAVPAPGCSSCAANAGTTDVTALDDRERTSVPAEPPPDPAGEVEAALRDFDAWYAAGRGTLPDPEPLPAGMCASCRLSPAVRLGKCFWCDLADTVQEQDLERTRKAAASRGRRNRDLALIGIVCWIIVIIGALTITGVL